MRAGLKIDPIERTNLALSAGAVAASWWLATPAFALSLGFGALLEAVNFRGLRRSAQFLFWGEIRGSRGWQAVFALRFGLLVIGIGSALAFGAHPVGLLRGALADHARRRDRGLARAAADRPDGAGARRRRSELGALERLARARARAGGRGPGADVVRADRALDGARWFIQAALVAAGLLLLAGRAGAPQARGAGRRRGARRGRHAAQRARGAGRVAREHGARAHGAGLAQVLPDRRHDVLLHPGVEPDGADSRARAAPPATRTRPGPGR